MPSRLRTAAIAALTLVGSLLSAMPAVAVVAPQKVVIIVGPVGTGTDSYRQKGDQTAAAAAAAGATVVKVYSPNATWANVRAAVEGANIVVYLGHGNGWPSPYSSTQNKDRVNGWGLNRVAGAGDGDSWSSTMVYCGEKAILGTLTSSDGSAQWQYCGGSTNTDGISPAPNWVMIYGDACYAPGASESWDTPATESIAYERVRNYSRPALAAGASAYYASDLGTADLVTDILQNPSLTWTDITRMKNGYEEAAQRHFAHPDVSTAQIWIQQTARWGGGSADYLFAFAGNPFATPEGGVGTPLPVPPAVLSKSPSGGSIGVASTASVTATFNQAVSGVSSSSFVLRDGTGATVPASVSYDAGQMRAELRPAAPLSSAKTYTVSLSGAIVSTDGVSLAPTGWSFTVQQDPSVKLTVTAVSPTVGATGVTTGVTLSARFSESVTGVGSWNFVLRDASGAAVQAAVTYDEATQTALLRPKAPLAPGTKYTAALYSSIKGVSGATWSGYSWTFTTQSGIPSTFSPAAAVIFKIGTHTGYQFSSTGAVLASKTYTLLKDSGANASARKTITNQSGTWLYIVNGVWAGYWIRESSALYLSAYPVAPKSLAAASWSTPPQLVFKIGTHTGYRFSSTGAVLASKTYTLLKDSGANTSARKTISNQFGSWYYVVNGVWAGYWVRASDVVYLPGG